MPEPLTNEELEQLLNDLAPESAGICETAANDDLVRRALTQLTSLRIMEATEPVTGDEVLLRVTAVRRSEGVEISVSGVGLDPRGFAIVMYDLIRQGAMAFKIPESLMWNNVVEMRRNPVTEPKEVPVH
jgi:hypothetical protein